MYIFGKFVINICTFGHTKFILLFTITPERRGNANKKRLNRFFSCHESGKWDTTGEDQGFTWPSGGIEPLNSNLQTISASDLAI